MSERRPNPLTKESATVSAKEWYHVYNFFLSFNALDDFLLKERKCCSTEYNSLWQNMRRAYLNVLHFYEHPCSDKEVAYEDFTD